MGADDFLPLSAEEYAEQTLSLGAQLLIETYRALCIGMRAYQYMVPWKDGAVCRFKYVWSWRKPREGVLIQEGLPGGKFKGGREAAESEGTNGDEAALRDAPEDFEADCGMMVVDEDEAALLGVLSAARQLLDEGGQMELAMRILAERGIVLEGGVPGEGELDAEGELSAERIGVGGEELTPLERRDVLNGALFALDVLGREDLERVREALKERIVDCETEINVGRKRMPAPKKKKRAKPAGTEAGRGKPFGKKRPSSPSMGRKVPRMDLCRMRVRKLRLH